MGSEPAPIRANALGNSNGAHAGACLKITFHGSARHSNFINRLALRPICRELPCDRANDATGVTTRVPILFSKLLCDNDLKTWDRQERALLFAAATSLSLDIRHNVDAAERLHAHRAPDRRRDHRHSCRDRDPEVCEHEEQGVQDRDDLGSSQPRDGRRGVLLGFW